MLKTVIEYSILIIIGIFAYYIFNMTQLVKIVDKSIKIFI